MTNGLSRPRKQFLDVLRVLATCAVVMMHVLTGATDVTDASRMPEYRGVLLSVMDLVTWCVPVFLLISGYLFLNPERKFAYPVMLRKYCRRIALAILLFGVPYAASELVVAERSFRMGMLPEALKLTLTGNTWSHMWYLYLILFLYLITPLLKKALQVIPVWGVVIVMAVLFLGSSVAPFANKLLNISSIPVLPDGGVYFFYYLCGYLFALRDGRVDRKDGGNGNTALYAGSVHIEPGRTLEGLERSRAWNVWLTAAGIVALGMVISRMLADFSVQMAYNYPFTVVLSVLIFAAGQSCRNSGHIDRIPWREMGLLSFAVYLVHPVYINLFYKFMKFTPFTLLERCGVENAVAGNIVLLLLLLVFCLAVLALATITAWVLRKIPVLRKYVL